MTVDTLEHNCVLDRSSFRRTRSPTDLLQHAGSVGEHGFQVGGRRRSTEQIALHLVAAQFLEQGKLLLCFHPLRDDRQIETTRHGDDGRNDGFIDSRCIEVCEKRPVDLDRTQDCAYPLQARTGPTSTCT